MLLRMTFVASVAAMTVATADAQPPGGGPPASPRAAAPIDLTGWWVSVITEDWRWRMVTPLRGDFANIPAAPAAYAVGAAWDPAKDEAAGEACKAYGAPAILRRPGRLHVTWADDDTLKIDTDEGAQTRLLRFRTAPVNEPPSLQGWSSARWEPPLRALDQPCRLGGSFSGAARKCRSRVCVPSSVSIFSVSSSAHVTCKRPGLRRIAGAP